MRWTIRTIQFSLCGIMIFGAAFAQANVILKISATNPSSFEARQIPLKSYLPKGILPEHVLNAGDLEVIYDEDRGQTYVYKDLLLEAQASETYEVEIEDIWLIEDETLQALNSQIENLVNDLAGSPYGEIALQIQQNVRGKIEAILRRQEDALIHKVGPKEHISAFDVNREAVTVIQGNINDLKRLAPSAAGQKRAGSIEQQRQAVRLLNAKRIKDQILNFGSGGDQESCLVEESLKVERENIVFNPKDTLVVRIEFENPSKTKSQVAPLKYFLAQEVQASDVVSLEELNVGFDFEKNLYYVYNDRVALDPGEKKEFEVILNNRWTFDKRRLYGLKVYVESLIKAAAERGTIAEAEELGRKAVNDIYDLLRRSAPAELTEAYVASSRKDLVRVDDIRGSAQAMEDILAREKISPELAVMEQELSCREARLNMDDTKDVFGLSRLLQAKRVKLLAGMVFKGKNLSTVSTWKVIFYIIIFLGIISGVFYYVNIREQKSVMFDPLTGAFARGYALERFREELKIAKGAGNRCTLLVMDVDKFKSVNDTYGHAAGDMILKEFVIAIRKGVRATDLIGRFGGDEFIIILPTGEKAIGLKIAQSIARIVEGTAIKVSPELTLNITTSIGVATFPEDSGTAEDLFDKADQALYEVKKRGGNGAEAFGNQV